MKFLADVNVVFPLLVSQHQHRSAALTWFDSTEGGEVVLCRLTQLGALRLLCTSAVMGPDVLSPDAAIEALGVLQADERIVFLPEPEGLDAVLQQLVSNCSATPNLWTDAYLAAFSAVRGLSLVSFDRGLAKFPRLNLTLLDPKSSA